MKTEQPNMKHTKEIPQYAIDKLPEGYTILGHGGDFECNGEFLGLAITAYDETDNWDDDYYEGLSGNLIYAAPTNSDIVKLNSTYYTKYDMMDGEPAETICEEALRIQGGDRQQDYGDPTPNHDDIANLWNSYIDVAFRQHGTEPKLEARDVAHMMILLKVARNCHKPKRDNWVDMAGYAQCGGKIDKV